MPSPFLLRLDDESKTDRAEMAHDHMIVPARGVLLFGYFCLDKQEKVSRPSGRDRTK